MSAKKVVVLVLLIHLPMTTIPNHTKSEMSTDQKVKVSMSVTKDLNSR